MKKTRIIQLTVLLALLLAIETTQVYAADQPLLQVSTGDIYLTAGQENAIKIELENTGDFNALDIEAMLQPVDPGIHVLSGYHKVFNEIGDKSTEKYYPVIYVDPDVPLGAYSLTLTVIYRRFGLDQDSMITVPVGVIVNQGYVPKIKHSTLQGSVKAKAGTENTVNFQVMNNWGQAVYDLEFALTSSVSYISIVEGVSYNFDQVVPGETVTVSPSLSVLEGTPLKAYSITAAVSYRDGDGKQFYQTISLPVNVDSASATKNTVITLKRMEVMQDKVQPGSIFDLELEVECSGADAYELLSTISFGQTSISPLTPTIISLGDIEVGQTVTASYSLLAGGDVSAGQYPITATITFTDSRGMPDSLTESLTVMLEGLIEFELLDTPTGSVKRGETAELESDLLLIGTESVQFVSIELIESGVFKRTSGSTEYIGAVDPDSPIPFDISYRVSDDADDGDYPLSLNLHYRDHLNREHDEELDLTVNVGGTASNQPDQTQQTGLWLWVRRLLGLGP